MRILLVEDDELLREGMRLGLSQYGYIVDCSGDGKEALKAAKTEHFDVILLDINLPSLSGIDVVKYLREKNITTPVLLLTSKDTINCRVDGLDFGADDCILKPFDLDELCARIRAIKRRGISKTKHDTITIGDITLDKSSRSVLKDGELLELSRREFVLLQMLMENVGQVMSRKKIIQGLYGWGDDVDSNALEVHIHNLRKKTGSKFISTLRGVGYKINDPNVSVAKKTKPKKKAKKKK